MHGHDRGFIKGLIAGILISVLIIGACAMSGCFSGGSTASSSDATGSTASEDGTQTDQTGETGSGSVSGDIDISGDYGQVEDKLNKIHDIIDQYYIGSDETITAQDLEDGIYKGYVDALDEPYTVYYSAEEYADLEESTSGKYSGIGVVVTENTDTGAVTVVRPFAGSPGSQAGILKDDIIYKVDGKEATGQDLNNVVSWIKGETGTTVEIEIYRPSDKQYYTYKVERKEIEVPMTEYAMLDDDIGYIAIYEFEKTTAEQFDDAVDKLTARGMKGLVIDLRDNPGGLVDAAADVLDRILPKDKLLVYTIDKKGEKDSIYSKDDETIDVPIAVLINENSASASEIVSGCLQDYDAATLVGTTSFGKGIVQYVLPLGDGSAVKLTSAKYYTPNGRNIHGTGIDPDVEVELEKDDSSSQGSSGSTQTAETGSTDESGSSKDENQSTSAGSSGKNQSETASETETKATSETAAQGTSAAEESETGSGAEEVTNLQMDNQLEKAEQVVQEKIK